MTPRTRGYYKRFHSMVTHGRCTLGTCTSHPTAGVHILSLDDPTSPVLAATFDTPDMRESCAFVMTGCLLPMAPKDS